jgi:hypothetical protein
VRLWRYRSIETRWRQDFEIEENKTERKQSFITFWLPSALATSLVTSVLRLTERRTTPGREGFI